MPKKAQQETKGQKPKTEAAESKKRSEEQVKILYESRKVRLALSSTQFTVTTSHITEKGDTAYGNAGYFYNLDGALKEMCRRVAAMEARKLQEYLTAYKSMVKELTDALGVLEEAIVKEKNTTKQRKDA